MALLDDKKRARNFYRYFSLIYDYINPLFYSKDMRRKVIEMAELGKDSLVVEVGSGTGFTTEEIIKVVPP
ncbi:MAG: chitin-binding protein, partial [Archaeoglobaceae archaeon]